MSMQGYFNVHRGLLESALWMSEPFTRGQAWVDLIGLASYKDEYVEVEKEFIPVKRGQCAVSVIRLCERWKWSRSKTLRYLKDLKDMYKQIDVEGLRKTSLITINNYNKFQANFHCGDTTKRTPEFEKFDTTENTTDDTTENTTDDTTEFNEITLKNDPFTLIADTTENTTGDTTENTTGDTTEFNDGDTTDDTTEYYYKKNIIKLTSSYEEASKQKDHISRPPARIREDDGVPPLPACLLFKNYQKAQEQINAENEVNKQLVKLIGDVFGVTGTASYKSALIQLQGSGKISHDDCAQIVKNPPQIDQVIGAEIDTYIRLKKYRKSSRILNRVKLAFDYLMDPENFKETMEGRIEDLQKKETTKINFTHVIQSEKEAVDKEIKFSMDLYRGQSDEVKNMLREIAFEWQKKMRANINDEPEDWAIHYAMQKQILS